MKLEGLTTQVFGRNCVELEEIDSTNHYFKREGADSPHGTLVLTRCQTAGKGRMGRQWAMTDRDALAMSLLLREFHLEKMAALPLLCGMAVAKALRKLTGGDFGIKWTNDVVCQGKKICGILCESQSLGNDTLAICGIGVNLVQDEVYFKERNLPFAASVATMTGIQLTSHPVAAEILNQMEPLYGKFVDGGFAALREEYRDQCVTLGKEVRVLYQGHTEEGTALDVADDGNLLCNIGGKVVKIAAGDASVRGLYGYV